MSHEQVVLRRLVRRDAAAVFEAFQSNPDMDRQGDVRSFEDAERYIEKLIKSGSPHEAWAIDEAGSLIGLVCVSVDEVNRSGWFWYWMSASARGRGLMGRAAATVADWAFTERKLERLELGHRINNPASGAVARAAGFVKEGTERGKFLIEGQRIDVDTYGRLLSDEIPEYEPILTV